MRLLLILTSLVFAMVATAAENPQQDTAPPAAPAEEILQPAPIETPADNAPGNDLILADIDADADADEQQDNRRFIPTEEISQDLGVSFPIDI